MGFSPGPQGPGESFYVISDLPLASLEWVWKFLAAMDLGRQGTGGFVSDRQTPLDPSTSVITALEVISVADRRFCGEMTCQQVTREPISLDRSSQDPVKVKTFSWFDLGHI